jgi:hypothetical protein
MAFFTGSASTPTIFVASSIGYDAQMRVKSLLQALSGTGCGECQLVTPHYLLDLVCSCRADSVNAEDANYRVPLIAT